MATMERFFEQLVPPGTAAIRIDRWIAENCPQFPRSSSAEDSTIFTLRGTVVKKSRKVKEGDLIGVRWTEHTFDRVEAQDIPLKILFEDKCLLVIDKQQNLVVHPGAGNPDGTLANALVHRYGERFFISETDGDEEDTSETSLLRPGIVHRLDKDTSGTMVVALNRDCHVALAAQFKTRTVDKYYIAIVRGNPPKRRGHIETSLVRDKKDRKRFTVGMEGEGKLAKTDYLVLRQYGKYALVRVHLLTGRTHQIRVHMRSIDCPILGDAIYGKADPVFPEATLMLHALSLELNHPESEERMRFHAPMPNRFKNVLRALVT